MDAMDKRPEKLLSGDIWSFPTIDGGIAFLRVVLSINDVVPTGTGSKPFLFVTGAYLVQVSKLANLASDMFQESNLLVAGTFLAPDKPWSEHNYHKFGRESITLADVEFPSWFTWVSVGAGETQARFFRGELEYNGKGLIRKEMEQRWGPLLLTRRYPEQLTGCFASGPVPRERLIRMDVRYHPARNEICEFLGVDLATPYCQLLSVSRARAYRDAIA
jgi:hypothetical protein